MQVERGQLHDDVGEQVRQFYRRRLELLQTSNSVIATMFFSLSNVNNNNNNTNNNNNNGYRLLSAQGMETLQTFLREHGNECIRQFVQVIRALLVIYIAVYPVRSTESFICMSELFLSALLENY